MTTTGPDRSPATTQPGAAPDPAPSPPAKPLPMDCCESGCARCVFDRYADELAQFHTALAAWQARNPLRAHDAD